MTSQTVDEFLGLVETARRRKNYPKMEEYADALSLYLGTDKSPDAWRARSQLSYERQMADYQQAIDSLEKAKLHAEQAIEEAQKAGDIPSELFALMTLGGHILPALGKGMEGMGMLHVVHIDAELLLSQTNNDEKELLRIHRIIMNCALHLMRLTAEYRGNPRDVKDFIRVLETNPVFQSYKDQIWARKALTDAQEFIASRP